MGRSKESNLCKEYDTTREPICHKINVLQINKNRIIMESKYVLILDFTIGCLNIIELTDEELKVSEEYEDFSDFLSTLEGKYGFRLKNSQWMVTETLSIYHYKDGEEVADAELV